MRHKISGSFLLLFLLVFTQTLYAKTGPKALALKAVSENSAESAPAIAELRAMGPAGLNALFQTYAREINEQVSTPLLAATPEWQRLSAALDVPWGDDGETTMAWLRPNPARGAAVLFYRLADAGRVRITVHDVAGRAVGRSIDEWRPAGLHRVALESGLPAEGIYLYRVETPARVVTGKFVFLK